LWKRQAARIELEGFGLTPGIYGMSVGKALTRRVRHILDTVKHLLLERLVAILGLVVPQASFNRADRYTTRTGPRYQQRLLHASFRNYVGFWLSAFASIYLSRAGRGALVGNRDTCRRLRDRHGGFAMFVDDSLLTHSAMQPRRYPYKHGDVECHTRAQDLAGTGEHVVGKQARTRDWSRDRSSTNYITPPNLLPSINSSPSSSTLSPSSPPQAPPASPAAYNP